MFIHLCVKIYKNVIFFVSPSFSFFSSKNSTWYQSIRLDRQKIERNEKEKEKEKERREREVKKKKVGDKIMETKKL